MPELTYDLLKDSEHSYLPYLFNNNEERFINIVRTTFPRGESDTLGYYILGEAEMLRENYAQAILYFNKSFCNDCDYLIYAYQQVNNLESANHLLERRRNELVYRGEQGELGLEKDQAILAYLENDIEEAIRLFKVAVTNGQLLRYGILMPMFNELKAHPEWPEIAKINKAGQEEQSAIYLELVARDSAGI
jgi:tetratricopeptide (TPR) repeat protein